MRTFLRKFGLFFLLFCSAMLVACNGNTTTGTAIVGITVSADELPDRLAVGDFQLSDLSITVMNSDGSSITLAASSTMVSTADLAKLATPGTHTITITYQGFTDTVQITLVDNGLTLRLMAIYDLGVSSGAIAVTYEEWLESVRGEDGTPGTDGRDVTLRVEAGIIQWQYVDSGTWTDLIAVSALRGAAGREVTFRISSGNLQWQYVGETTWKTLLSLQEITGTDGITPTISISPEGFWVINGTVTDFRAVPLTPETVTVDLRFELNGGTLAESVASEYLDIPRGEAVTLPIPEKHGYVFAGWFTGNTVNDGQFLNTSPAVKDLMLHARWQADVSPIETLLSTLISGTNYVADFTMIEQAEGVPDYREDRRMTTAVDEWGQIHRTRTVVRMNGSEISQSTFRSSIIIGEYEYFYQEDRLDDTVNAGRTYPDSLKNKADWDAPRVDSIYQWFRIEDFRLREDEYVFDYVASDDGLRAYASYVVGSGIDYDRLTAVFNGDAGILTVTIPCPDEELPDRTLIQTIQIVETGTVTDRFLFEDFQTALIDNLQSLVDTRIEQTLPTPATETPFLVLYATLSEPLPAITDPVKLWDDVVAARDQLVEFPLVSDPRRIAVAFARQDLLVHFNHLSLTATEDSILAMRTLMESQNAELLATVSVDQVAPLLASFLTELESEYVPDQAKIDYLEAKDRVNGYLDETELFFHSILASGVSVLYAEVAEARVELEAAATAEAVEAIWEGFGLVLQNAGLVLIDGYGQELAVWQEAVRTQFLTTALEFAEDGIDYARRFDQAVRPELDALVFASVYDFMFAYFQMEELMETEAFAIKKEILLERFEPLQNLYAALLTPYDLYSGFVNVSDPFLAALDSAESVADLDAAWDGFHVSVGNFYFYSPIPQKRQLWGYVDDLAKKLMMTANDDSALAIAAIRSGLLADLSPSDVFMEETNSLYVSATNAIYSAYSFEGDRLVLEEAKLKALNALSLMEMYFGSATNYADHPMNNNLKDAILRVRLSSSVVMIDAVLSEAIAKMQTVQVPQLDECAAWMQSDLISRTTLIQNKRIPISADLLVSYDAFMANLDPLNPFGSSFADYWFLLTAMDDLLWEKDVADRQATLDQWYAEKSAIVPVSYLDQMTPMYEETRFLVGVSPDITLRYIMTNRFQQFLISLPTDPVRMNRYLRVETLNEVIDGYGPFVTSSSWTAMRSLLEECADLLELETETIEMDALRIAYVAKIHEAYEEDPGKVAFQNLKERYFTLLDQFYAVFVVSADYSAYSYNDFVDLHMEAVSVLDAMEYRPDAQTVMDGYVMSLFNYYLMCNGDEFIGQHFLLDEVEYLFHDYVTGGDFYLDGKTLEMNAIRSAAREEVFSSVLLEGLYAYADYAMEMKSFRLDSHRTGLLDQMNDEYEAMWIRLPETARPDFTSAYLDVKTLMETVERVESLEILYGRFETLLWQQVADPLLDAKRDGIETIQQVLDFLSWTATDDSRTQMCAAQTAAYDAIDAALTAEDTLAAYVNGRMMLEAAYVEDPLRSAFYQSQMNDAEIILNQKEQIVNEYGEEIDQINQAIVVIYIHKTMVWTSGSLSEATSALNDATAALESLGLVWNVALVDELKATCLDEMLVMRGTFETIPSEVENAFVESATLIEGSADPLIIIPIFESFAELVQTYS